MVSLSWLDSSIVVCYLCGIFCIGMYAWWDNRSTKRSSSPSSSPAPSKNQQAESYFLASRNVLWLSVGATLFSSNIGAEHFIGLAGTAASTGIAVGAFEWTAAYMLYIMAYWLTDLYILSGIVTTPEYLELRFNRAVRIYNAIMTLFIYVFVVISTTLYAGSVILETVLGWNIWTSSLALIIATGIYVVLGGLKAVVWTENIQTCILLIGGTIVMVFSLYKVGGLAALRSFYDHDSSVDEQHRDNMHMFRSWKDADWPWPGIVFGIFCNSYYYWNGQHLIVQRVLAAKSPLHARLGCILTTLLKILPVFIMVIPGMCALQLFPEQFANQTSQEYDRAYPLLVINILPIGLVGIVIASMLSALMSSLAAVYNSASTIIVNDLYKLWYPHISDQRSVMVGRVGACIFVAVSVLWLPSIQNHESELFVYTQNIISYVNAPLTVVYVFAHFWNRANMYGAYVALALGFMLGIPRFLFAIVLENKYCHNIFCESNYLYFAMFLTIVCSVGMVVGSLATKKPDWERQVEGLTYWTIKAQMEKKKSRRVVSDEGEEVEAEEHDDKTSEICMVETNVSEHGNIKHEKKVDMNSPLMKEMKTKQETKNDGHRRRSTICNKCVSRVLYLVRLEGGEQNRVWSRMTNVVFFVSLSVNIAMWIWFR